MCVHCRIVKGRKLPRAPQKKLAYGSKPSNMLYSLIDLYGFSYISRRNKINNMFIIIKFSNLDNYIGNYLHYNSSPFYSPLEIYNFFSPGFSLHGTDFVVSICQLVNSMDSFSFYIQTYVYTNLNILHFFLNFNEDFW